MRVTILHLSDMHLRNGEDPLLKRATHIADAATSVTPSPDGFILAVTGDVAHSGKAAEYECAAGFYGRIREILLKCGKPVFEFYVPGNHDLDFDLEPDTRPALLKSLGERVDALDKNGETVRQLLSLQDAFFRFEAMMLKSESRPTHDRLVYSHCFPIADGKVRVNCYNTAWVSTKPEKPGQLLFPTGVHEADPDAVELVISAFHHTYNWLEPKNARVFCDLIESTSDVVMTGHEHESTIFEKRAWDLAITHYIEGGILQGSSSGPSCFNVILIDTAERTYEPYVCKWTGDLYSQSSLGVREFVRNKSICKSVFRNNPDFLLVLDDPGIPILHPLKHEVKLEDLYIYPSLGRRNPGKRTEPLNIVDSEQVLEFFESSPYVLILGDELSGKTCFAKKLYHDLQFDRDLVPILINGEDFAGYKEKDVRRIVTNAVIAEYSEEFVDRFFRLERAQRVLMLDDWHKVRYDAKGRVPIMEHLKGLFGRIIVFTSSFYAFEEVADIGPIRQVFSDFEFCDIKEFGRRLTGKLIEKWHLLGREYSDDVREYSYLVAISEHMIFDVIRKGILPTYPIFIIGLLQAQVSPGPTMQNAGSYGHIIEAVITTRLAEVTTPSTNIGLLYTYASRIAYTIFKKERQFLSSRELHQVHDEYCKAYQMNIPQTKVIADLVNAKVLHKDADSYRFTYKGCYYYFVARYFSENLNAEGSALRSELSEMADRIGWEDYKNIVLFFLYLTRDAKLLEQLLFNAEKMYGECEPSDLEGDVRFVNKLLKEKPKKLLLPSTDIQSNRDEYRRQQDEAETSIDPQNEGVYNKRVPYYEPGLDEITRLVIALKHIWVMGQVLRSFPGVLPAEPMYRLAEGSYLLGLRTLRRLLTLAEKQLEALRVMYAEIFRAKHPLATIEEVENSADQSMIWLAGAVSYGMIKRIACSVGHEQLELTFEQVRKNLGEKTSIRLIDLAIHLEYFREANEAEIFDLERQSQQNLFAYRILRNLVSEFLYLNNTDWKVFQRLGNLFGIEANDPRYMLNRSAGTAD